MKASSPPPTTTVTPASPTLSYSLRRPRGNNPWTVRYREGKTWREHRLDRSVTTKAQAKQAAEAWLSDRLSSGTVEPSLYAQGPTIAEVGQVWLEMRGKDERLAKSTVRENRHAVNKWIGPKLGNIEASRLDVPKLREWVRDIRGALSSSRCRNVCSTLRTMLDDLAADGVIRLHPNPMRHSGVLAEIPGAASEHEDIAYLEPSVVQQLLDCHHIPEHRRLRYLLACSTGMRDSEIAGLQWADVDLESVPPTLTVTQAFSFGDGGSAELGRTKSRKSKRTIVLNTPTAGALRLWLDDGWQVRTGKIPGPKDHVLPSKHGKPSRPDSPSLLRRDLNFLGLPTASPSGQPYVFHHLRHSFSTWLADAGVPSDMRSTLLGHAGKSVEARHYTAATLSRMAIAVEQVPLRWPTMFVRASEGIDEGASNGATVSGLGTHVGGGTHEPQKPRATHGSRTHDLRFTKMGRWRAVKHICPQSSLDFARDAAQGNSQSTSNNRPIWAGAGGCVGGVGGAAIVGRGSVAS